jgi:hypothetical protein
MAQSETGEIDPLDVQENSSGPEQLESLAVNPLDRLKLS